MNDEKRKEQFRQGTRRLRERRRAAGMKLVQLWLTPEEKAAVAALLAAIRAATGAEK
jgi:predicted DNA-binding transcriptional regulator YafY